MGAEIKFGLKEMEATESEGNQNKTEAVARATEGCHAQKPCNTGHQMFCTETLMEPK
jgi:hypothetical protein